MSVVKYVLSAALLFCAGCDLVRLPGDTRPPPVDVPEGAPGPPPPSEPVDDPYGTGTDTTDASETSEEVDDLDTDADSDLNLDETSDAGDPADSDLTETPDADEGSESDTDASETDTTDTDADETDADDTDVADTPDAETPEPLPVAFTYHAPGALLPGSGDGQTEQIVHAPDMVFPIKDAPAYLQSQVFTFGGGVGGGDQCDARNYAYPWRDNFCETRTSNRNSPFCPTSRIHQGQDIRVGTAADCNALRRADRADRTLHPVVAVEDGQISHIGSYSVNLRSGGRLYKYLHLNMQALEVDKYDQVSVGDTIGFISNDFGGVPTTFHLHFEIVQNMADLGWVPVPPYVSLVEAYERREAGRGALFDDSELSVATAPVEIPDGMEIIE